MDNTFERQPRAPPQGGSWLIPLGFFVLLGFAASGIRWFAVGWVFLLSFVSTYAFMYAIVYRRKRFGRRGGTVHPAFEEEERKGDRFLCGIILALTIFLPESIVYVLGAATFIVVTSRLFIR
jgi:cobalamin synthase